MRPDNLLIALVGIVALAVAILATVRWGRLPLRDRPDEPPATSADARLVAALLDVAALLAAAWVSGVVVAGGLARLVMRLTAATSGDVVQGSLTDADEAVGEISRSGTLAVLFFVGMAGAVAMAIAYLVLRPWLPGTARAAGLVVGVGSWGVLVVADGLSADNPDFVLLSPVWLAVASILGSALLFGLAFAAFAARFDRLARSGSRWRWALLPSLVLLLVPMVLALVVVYVGGRVALPGRLRPILQRRPVQVAGRLVVVAGALGCVALTVGQVVEII